MCLVAFIACILKKPDIEEEDGAGEDINNVIVAHDEEMLHKGHEELDGNLFQYPRWPYLMSIVLLLYHGYVEWLL